MSDSESRRQFIQKAFALISAVSASPSVLAKQTANNKVGVVLDPLFLKHDMRDHPENANRLKVIDDIVTKENLWQKLTPIQSRYATEDELLSCHTSGYIEEIRLLSDQEPGYYNEYQQDTYFNHYTYNAARMAAGSNIDLNLAIYDRKVETGFALLRPPGHHALENKAMGFCIFNSDVIAAKALQKQRGVKRIAIIDFDVHHGNGTQDLTDKDPSIMAISIH